MSTATSSKPKKDLLGLSKATLASVMQSLGEKPFRAKQIFEWLYKRQIHDFAQMDNLGKGLRETLLSSFTVGALTVHKVQRSQRDGTAKYLFKCADGELVESVFLPHEGRNTACLSTQVGCAMGCTFCATGESGFGRNLIPSEIVAQILGMEADQGAEIHNLVLMGMGEPLHNWDNVREAMSALLDSAGRNWGPRKITLSTCGVVSGIDQLTSSGLKLRLAISLHAPHDDTRNQIMPINKRYPLKELMRACRDYQKATGLQLTFEYTLFAGLNDSVDQAHAVADLIKGLEAKINLIPYNSVSGLAFKAPHFDTVIAFQDALKARGIVTMVRTEKGGDIDAACGQLRREGSLSEARFWARTAAAGAALGGLVFFMVMQFSVKGGTVTMPDLRGLPVKAAEIKLQGQGLTLQVREERYSNTAAFGAVLEQSMEPGATLKRGRTIAVVVSIGNKVLTVPQLVGSASARQAQLLLEQNGLKPNRISYIFYDAPRETVLGQAPQAGHQASRGEGVSLLVSAGPRNPSRIMPDLRGVPLDSARALAGRMGLVLRRVTEGNAPKATPGSVISQTLTPNARVELGQELALVVMPGGSADIAARLVSVAYDLPEDGVQERRLRMVVRDQKGERVVHNRMQQPGARVREDVKVYGEAHLEITLAGQVVETKEIP